MKVLICSNLYPPDFVGGAEIIAHQQAKELAHQGHLVQVFTGDIKQGPYERFAMRTDQYEGLTVHRVHLTPEDFRSDLVNFTHPEAEDKFKLFLDSFQPDIVHFHNLIGFSVRLISIAKYRKIKTVLTFHDHWGLCFRNTAMRPDGSLCNNTSECHVCSSHIIRSENFIPSRMKKDYLAIQLNEVDHFISPSQYLAQWYIKNGLPSEKFSVIWYGVNVERFSTVKKQLSDKTRITFVGYFGHHKGVHTLIEAISKSIYRQNLRLNLVGGGEELEKYRALISKFGCENQVKFWGKIDNSEIEKVYQQTDIFVLPSIWPENHPVTINEAMACSIPVITSRIGGSQELVIDGETGYHYTPGDSSDLAAKIDNLIQSPQKMVQFGRNGRRRIEEASLPNQVSKIVDLYQSASINTTNDKDAIIAWSGTSINDTIFPVVQKMIGGRYSQPRFIHSEWLEEEQLQRAKIYWISEPEPNINDILAAIKRGIPLLVPEANNLANEICTIGNCGLHYSDSDNFEECIKSLLINKRLRRQMSENTQKIWTILRSTGV